MKKLLFIFLALAKLLSIPINKLQLIELQYMIFTCFHCIDSCCIDIRMPQNVRELYNITAQRVKRSREQMAKIVRKYFQCTHARSFRKFFHFAPNIRTVKRISVPCDKDRACFYTFLSDITHKQLSEFGRYERASHFALV